MCLNHCEISVTLGTRCHVFVTTKLCWSPGPIGDKRMGMRSVAATPPEAAVSVMRVRQRVGAPFPPRGSAGPCLPPHQSTPTPLREPPRGPSSHRAWRGPAGRRSPPAPAPRPAATPCPCPRTCTACPGVHPHCKIRPGLGASVRCMWCPFKGVTHLRWRTQRVIKPRTFCLPAESSGGTHRQWRCKPKLGQCPRSWLAPSAPALAVERKRGTLLDGMPR